MITYLGQRSFRTPHIYSASTVKAVRRRLSAWSLHSRTPATLYRLNEGPKSNLFDFTHHESMRHRSVDDGQILDNMGMVSLMTCSKAPYSNGAILMPNTFMMQEIIRQAVDQYFDDTDEGLDVDVPFILTLAKGIQLPKDLILVREHLARFSLQPAHPMNIEDLNALLDRFYSENTVMELADKWLDSHEFGSASADDAEAEWMEK